jgi:hypothetical protein
MTDNSAMKHKLVALFSTIKSWVHSHKKESIAIGTVLFIVFVYGMIVLFSGNDGEISRTTPGVDAGDQTSVTPETAPSPLTGVEVSPELAKRPVTAIVIENSPDARPQSSLNEAGFVFEAIAEGGITRFLALYQESRPDPIGPVRSLRPYFTDFVLTFDASIAHVGGSSEALKEAAKLGLKDLDQFSFGDSYYRTTDRFAPHNVYTDFDLLDALNKKLGYTASKFTSFERKAADPVAKKKAKKITVSPSSYLYESSYVYSTINNNYKRSIAGKPDKDRETGEQISPDVLIVIEANYTVSQDGRYHYKLTGKGKATIFQDGDAIVGTWKKADRDAQFNFVDGNGDSIKLNAGQVWMTVLDPSQEVEYSI